MKHILFAVCLYVCTVSGQTTFTDTITLNTYNLLNFEDEPSNLRSTFFRKVFLEFPADIVVVQELIEGGAAAMFRDSVMLPVNPDYAMAPFLSSFDTDRCLYYDSTKFSLLDADRIDTELRDIQQYLLEHKLSGTTFYVFTLHLKATSGDAAQRKREIDSLRKVTDALPDTIPFIVGGDFNIYNEGEAGYNALLHMDGPGYFIDPLQDSLSSTWNNSGNAPYHTQSTRTSSFGGGSTGGLDDRFDMILYSAAIGSGKKMSYVEGSTVAIGNDGAHYNDAIADPPFTIITEELADALHQASDHLPLEARFVFHWTESEDTTVVDTTINAISGPYIPELTLYPNPADDRLTIEAEGIERVFMTDLRGVQMAFFDVNADRLELSVESYPAGIYLVHVYTRNGKVIGKWVKR